MIDISEGAGTFAARSLEAFSKCGAAVGELENAEDFEIGPEDAIVVLGVVGAWKGAVAFRFDPSAISATAEAMAGEPVDDEDLVFEALLEAVNVVAGRGAAALAEFAGGAVWLTPPLLAEGPDMAVRLFNFSGNSFQYGLGAGGGGLLFSAAPSMGGRL